MHLRVFLSLGIVATTAFGCLAADASKLPGGTWASIQKLPELNGIWETNPLGDPRGLPIPGQLSLTPKYAAMRKEFQSNPDRDSPQANCVPPGMPGIMDQPYPIEILYTPGMVVLIAEAYMQVRHIFTDGRSHPDDPDLTYNGNSIGHWDGDTLVVDSVGFVKDTPLGRNMEARHSEKMHIVERFHLKDPNTLQVNTTIDDPEAFAKPWTGTLNYARHPDWTMEEYICQQNNRNFVDANGKAGINLKP
jgi:hypothetical protein